MDSICTTYVQTLKVQGVDPWTRGPAGPSLIPGPPFLSCMVYSMISIYIDVWLANTFQLTLCTCLERVKFYLQRRLLTLVYVTEFSRRHATSTKNNNNIDKIKRPWVILE